MRDLEIKENILFQLDMCWQDNLDEEEAHYYK
jgi:hypothetical protein